MAFPHNSSFWIRSKKLGTSEYARRFIENDRAPNTHRQHRRHSWDGEHHKVVFVAYRVIALIAGFGEFARKRPDIADPASIVSGTLETVRSPDPVFITHGPSGQVKHIVFFPSGS